MTGLCEMCGAHDATREWDEGSSYEFWSGLPRYTPVCESCWTARDTEEPPEPDGEAFRGGEAAAYQAEQMAQARRLK